MTQLFSFWQAQAQDGQGVMISLQKDEKETQHLGFAEAASCEYVHFTSVGFSPAIRGEVK